MAINSPKHKEEVLVKAHTREGRSVKSFRRLQEVGLGEAGASNKVSKKEFFNEYDNISKSIFDKDGEIRTDIPDDKLELHGKTLLCMSKESGVDQLIFNKSNVLKTLVEDWGPSGGTIPSVNTPFRDVMASILDRDGLESTIGMVDAIERRFGDYFKIPTERVDPFTFKFKPSQDTEFGIFDLLTKSHETLSKHVGAIGNNHHGIFKSEIPLVADQEGLVSDMQSMFKKHGENKFNSTNGPSVILTHLGEYDPKYHVPVESMFKVDAHLMQSKINTDNYINTNPDNLKNLLTKELAKVPDFDRKNDIIDFFKKIDAGSVVPAANLLINSGVLPTFMLENKNFLKDVRKMSDASRQFLSVGKKPTEGKDIYVSKNPLNILTMSPEKTIPSCQSISVDGDFLTTPFNVNVPATQNTQHTNDFIMYMTDKNNEKNARISLSYDVKSQKFLSYEDRKVYGQDIENVQTLDSMVENFGQHFDDGIIKPPTTNEVKNRSKVFNSVERLQEAIQTTGRNFQQLVEGNHFNEMKDMHSKTKEGHDLQNERKGELVDKFIDECDQNFQDILEKSRTMLYGSEPYYMVRTQKELSDHFKSVYKDVGLRYKRLIDYMETEIIKNKTKPPKFEGKIGKPVAA